MAIIEIKNLSVTYQNKKNHFCAVNDLSATFSQPINTIVGYSGCGKTTLLRSILGVLSYDGDIYLDGMDIFDVPPKNRNFSYVSQEFVLYPHMTVFDNIAFPLKTMGADRAEIINRVNRMAELTGLTPCLTRKPKHISGGQQQRVALARAFIKNPVVCCLDEPFSNIDVQLRFQFRQLLRKLSEETGCMLIYVTHDFQEALAFSNQIFVMNDGKIEATGSPEDIMACENEVVKLLREGSLQSW